MLILLSTICFYSENSEENPLVMDLVERDSKAQQKMNSWFNKVDQ